ncbi:flavin reductase family protein [Labrys neptuniae]
MTASDRLRVVTPMELTPSSRAPVERAEFSEAMSRLAATVCIVAGQWQGERQGRLATAVVSLSATPPSILVSIDRTSRLADLILASGHFSVAMLASGQDNIADAFAGKLGDIDRFDIGAWQSWSSGMPLLSEAAAAVDCEVIGSLSITSHLVFAGAIVETKLTQASEPLLWHRRGYHRPAPLSDWPPIFTAEPQPWPTPAD